MISDSYLEEIHAALAARAESVCRALLPGGKRIAKVWQCGGVDGGPGKSMGVELEGDKAGVWCDRATGETGRLLRLFELTRGLKFADAVEQAAEFCKMNKTVESDRKVDPSNFHFTDPSETKPDPLGVPAYKAPAPAATIIDWARCVGEFTAEKAAELCEWRGYSVEHVTWMKENELIGCFQVNFAFPVHNAKGQVVAIHHKIDSGWLYYPKGSETTPLIIGSPVHALHTLAFESQWDAFAVLDKLGVHEPDNAGIYAAYITRSATSNTDISSHAITNLIAVNQNDPKEKKGKDGVIRSTANKEGRTPSEEWLHRISSSRNKITQFAVFEPPAKYKDANDWIRGEQPEHAEVFKKVIENSRDPILKDIATTDEILATNITDDPNALIGHHKRFLSKGGSWLIVGQSGIGKSTLIASLCIHAAAGVSWHGLTFRRPLKTLVVQAENDRGDLAEMLRGAFLAAGFDSATAALARKNIVWRQECSRTGTEFCVWLEKVVSATGAELVIIDPLLSYVGDDISQQKVASAFLRNGLQPIQQRTGCITVAVHHTGKPSKDQGAHKGWSESDYSYLGLGSSDVTNWARAISVFTPVGVDTGIYRFLITKRGKRAGMIDLFSKSMVTSIFLKHAGQGLGWIQCEPPEESQLTSRNGGRKRSLTGDTVLKALGSAATIMRRDILTAELMLKHEVSNRTVKDRIDALLLAAKIHVAEKSPREGGGHEIEWLRAGTSSI
jgi:AAA domain